MASDLTLRITRLTGGRNGFDSPLVLSDDQCRDAYNVDFWRSPCGSRRLGAAAFSYTFSAGGPFSGSIGTLLRHIPGEETAAELWGIDGNATNRFSRMAAGTAFYDVTLKDNLSSASDAVNVVGASMPNGLFFLCYNAAGGVNRLHVYDPVLDTVRRVGMATPNAPTVLADGGGGLTWTRFYRVRDVRIVGSSIITRSEASSSVSISIAAKLGATVTKGAATNENETHWELEASDTAAGPWYRIAQTVIGTTTFDDTNATIPTTNLSPVDGINTPPPGAKYIIATDARLILANAFDTSGGFTTPKNNRVWFTPVIGDNDVGDLERIPTGRYLDVDAVITGLSQPINGVFYVFSYRKIWRFVPTGDPTAPYTRYTVSTSIGCIRHQSIVAGEDEQGNPCIYFLSHRGPYRAGANGVQFLGLDISDLWATVNLSGSCFGVYHADKHQIWYWLSTSAVPVSAFKVAFDTRRGEPEGDGQVRKGWVRSDGDSAVAYSAVMFSNTPGASMSRDLKPYIAQGKGGTTGRIWKCDADGTWDDNGTTFQAFIDTKEYTPTGMTKKIGVGMPILAAGSQQSGLNASITIEVHADFELSNSGTVPVSSQGISITASANKRTFTKWDGIAHEGAYSVAFRFGDQGAFSSVDWFIDTVMIPIDAKEPV